MTYDDLQMRARALVEVLVREAPELGVLVVLSAPTGNGETERFACETNYAKGTDAARICRTVAAAIEAPP